MARGTLPPGVRMRIRGGQQQPVRGLGRGEMRPRLPAGQSPILGGRGRIVQRGQLAQTRGGGVLRGQPVGRVLPGRGRANLRGMARPQMIRGAGPQGVAQPMMMRPRQPAPRMIPNFSSVVAPMASLEDSTGAFSSTISVATVVGNAAAATASFSSAGTAADSSLVFPVLASA